MRAELTAERLRELLSYDPETGNFKWRVTKGRARAGDRAGCIYTRGYAYIRIGGAAYKAHRLAWLYVHGHWPKEFIDHINGHRADNRLVNLREANRIQNFANSRLSCSNTSGFKGVSWDKRWRKWISSIGSSGRTVYLGWFDTPEEAHSAYMAEARKLHGEFASNGIHEATA
jgi:hypothetical protein